MDKLLLVILFLFSVISINAQDDFDCIDRFLKGIDKVSLFPSSTITMYCHYTQNIKCDNENKVTFISINSNNSSFVLDSSYLNCFSKLENFELSNFILNDNIFYSPITSQSLNTFSVIFPNIASFSLSQPIKINMSVLKLTFTDSTSISPITLQYLQNIKKSITISNDLGNIKYLNNGNQIKLPSIYISSVSVPDLTNIEIEFLQLIVPGATGGSVTFNTSSFENFKSFGKVKNFVYQSGSNRYPIELHSMSTNNIMESLEMSLIISNSLSALDFTMFKSLKKLKFSKSVNLFYNSNIPIGLYPESLQEFDFIENSLINFPDLSKIISPFVNLGGNNITSITNPFNSNYTKILDLSNNPTIQNTIDDSFCKTITILKDNSMNGILPDCIKCHLSDTNISSWYSGNNFDLTPLIECSSIIPKMKILNDNTYLYGSNLGFLSNSIKSIPPINFQVDIPSTSFYSTPQYKTSTLFNISFTSSGSNKQFTISNDPYYPTPKSITFKTNSMVEFIGEYFTYDKSIVTIIIDTVNCVPIEVDFYRILCNLTTPPIQSNSNIPITIKIDNLSSSLKINSNSIGIINPIGNCKDSCNRGGSCNFETLKCQCDQLHFGEYCENKAIQCNDPTCGGGIGICDKKTGQCDCGLIYTGNSCELPAHWVSSIEPPLESGGIVLLNGYFSNQHTNLSVMIGNQPCTISNSSPPTISTITCSIGPGNGIKNITVIQNTVTWFSNSMFQYFNENYHCPNDCSNHGTCNSNSGICSCTGDWSGFDCSSKSNHQTNTTIDNGSVTLSNQDTIYSISIFKLIEIDFNGNIVKEFNFTNNLSWDKSILIDQITNSKIIKYNKQIIYDSTNLISTNITTTFEEVTKTSERSFAGVNFQLERGSVKLSISITNYPYKNYLNSLQLLLKSDSTNDNNNCDADDNLTNLEKDQSQNSQLDYITIKKLDKVLKGRFINRVISDDRSTFITNSIDQSKSSPDQIIITFNLPHCTKECLLDPDFSVLVDPDFSTSCDSKSRKWVIPVAVVVSVVGFVALVVLTVILYKKNRINIQIRLKTLRDK
ncbi:hypothetical protein ACTFIZ_003405 [Dictyostelium cf. discoideum]